MENVTFKLPKLQLFRQIKNSRRNGKKLYLHTNSNHYLSQLGQVSAGRHQWHKCTRASPHPKLYQNVMVI